jgi:hypothetical protein
MISRRYLFYMMKEDLVRFTVRSILLEAADIDRSLTGKYNSETALVFGDKSKKYLTSPERGTSQMSDWEFNEVFTRLNNTTLEKFRKYDGPITRYASEFGLKPGLLKAMAIEETTLGKDLLNKSGGTAAGLIQITKGTLATLNNNLPKGVHYSYDDILSNPDLSVKAVAHYISHYLIGKKGLKDRSSILRAYKTGPDSENYVKRVNAYKKLVDIIGF